MISLYEGDCLTESERIEDGSVDLILCDPPYGNMDTDGGRRLGINGWDMAIKPADLFEIANRILRRNGKLVLFAQEPYTSRLITEAIPNLPFGYLMIWEKDHFANSLIAKKAPVSYFEDILVFNKDSGATPPHDFEGLHPLRDYFAKVQAFIGLSLGEINKQLGHRRAEHSFYTRSTQFSLCTESTYNNLIKVFNIDKLDDFQPYDELRTIDISFKEGRERERQEYLERHNEIYPSVFNLPPGAKYKSNILRYKKDYDGYHPAQKPVALLGDLI